MTRNTERATGARKPAAPPQANGASDGALSASRRVYLTLRQRIVDMVMAPGTRIVELDIAAEHGLSRTPVHEAVQRLAEEGLIEILQRVGTFVARIPIDQLEESMLIRTALEIVIVEKAAANADAEGVALLRRILAEQQGFATANDADAFHRSDEAFHAALAELAGCPGVWRTIQQTKAQVDRFRRLTLPIEGRMKGVVEEHTQVVEAIEHGAPQDAVAAMREHLDHVLPVVEMTRSFRPEFFVNRLAVGTDRKPGSL